MAFELVKKVKSKEKRERAKKLAHKRMRDKARKREIGMSHQEKQQRMVDEANAAMKRIRERKRKQKR